MRCYNGCPGTKSQKQLKETEKLQRKLYRLNPMAHCTFFPMEQFFLVHEWGVPISGEYENKNDALKSAIKVLEAGKL